jgi:hypothetical protein
MHRERERIDNREKRERFYLIVYGVEAGLLNMNKVPSMFFFTITSSIFANAFCSLSIPPFSTISVRLDSRYAKFQSA